MKNGPGKMDPQWDFAHFSISAAIFRLLRAWGHFPFSFPFWGGGDFCVGLVSHSVYGHFDRNPKSGEGSSLVSALAACPASAGRSCSKVRGCYRECLVLATRGAHVPLVAIDMLILTGSWVAHVGNPWQVFAGLSAARRSVLGMSQLEGRSFR